MIAGEDWQKGMDLFWWKDAASLQTILKSSERISRSKGGNKLDELFG